MFIAPSASEKTINLGVCIDALMSILQFTKLKTIVFSHRLAGALIARCQR